MNRDRIAGPYRVFAFARALARAGAALVLLALGAAPASPEDYPRLGLYGHVDGRGYPLVLPDDSLNLPMIDEVSRYHAIILDSSPLTEYRPDVLTEIRARRPDIKLFAYAQANYIWNAREPDSLVNIPTKIRNMVRNNDGFLYNAAGQEYNDSNINMAKRDAQGRLIIAEKLADIFVDDIMASGHWDGLFLDRFCSGIQWMQGFGDSIDYVRAGYPNFPAFDAAWRAGSDTLAQRLRRRLGPTPLLVANCGSGIFYDTFNGWLREGFPDQNGGTWEANMFRNPGGYLYDQTRFRTPHAGWIVSWPVGSLLTPYTFDNLRRARWSLGSAALGEGYGTHNPPQLNVDTGYMSWWYDEYAVNRVTGLSSTLAADTGWLGLPMGPATLRAWAQPGVPDAGAMNPGFETNVTTGWTFETSIGSTVARVVGGAADGAASARISIPAASDAWSTSFTTVGTTPYSFGTFTAVFWAKASVPRTIWVNPVNPAGAPYPTALVAIDTTWKRHAVLFNGSLGTTARLQFRVGTFAGDLWLDDVHFQLGTPSLWQRDFAYGTVLVNPWYEAKDVPIAKSMRRITGLRDPAVNNGAVAKLIHVNERDAVFLLKTAQDLVAVDEPVADGVVPRLAWSSASPTPARAGAESVRLVLSAAQALDRVDVSVFDTRGRRVRAVFTGALPAGTHTLAWDGRDESGRAVAPGLYFARARAGTTEAIRKLVCR